MTFKYIYDKLLSIGFYLKPGLFSGCPTKDLIGTFTIKACFTMGVFTDDAKKKLLAELTDEELAKLYEYKFKGVIVANKRPKENLSDVIDFITNGIGRGIFWGSVHLLLFKTYQNNEKDIQLVVDSIPLLKERLGKFGLPFWFSHHDEEAFSLIPKTQIPAPKADVIIHPTLGEVKLKYELRGEARWHAFERFCVRTANQFNGRTSDYTFLEEALINSFKRSKPTHLPTKRKVLRSSRGQTRSSRRGGGKAIKVEVSFEALRMINNDFEEAEYFLDEELNMRYVVVKANDGSKILKTAEKPYSH